MGKVKKIAAVGSEEGRAVIGGIAATLALLVSGAGAMWGQAVDHPPDGAQMLEAVRARAMQYSHSLPDFICDQITHRDVSKRGGLDSGAGVVGLSAMRIPGSGQRSAGDDANRIDEKLTYIGGREEYTVISVDGRHVTGVDHQQFEGATSKGEFGSLLESIFDPKSKAMIAGGKMSNVHGRRAYTYTFRVPKEHGAEVLIKDTGREVVVAYAGRVLVDADTLDVMQIDSVQEIPVGFPVASSEVRVDYAPTPIAGQFYSLPTQAEVRMEDRYNLYVNRIDYRNYQKFTVKSVVHMGDEAPQ